MTLIVSYLKSKTLSEDRERFPKANGASIALCINKRHPLQKGFSQLYLRCLILYEKDYFMREFHEGVYGNHSRAQSLVHKLIHAEYYWPTMHKDTQSYVKACDRCQHFSNIIRQPSE